MAELTSLKCVNVSPTNPSGGIHEEVTRGRMGRVTHFQVSCGIKDFQINGETRSLILNYVAIFRLHAVKISFFFCRNIGFLLVRLVRLSCLGAGQVPGTLKEFARYEATDFVDRFIYWLLRPDDSIPYRRNLCILSIFLNQLKDEIPIWGG